MDRELVELRERLAGKDELIGELRERLAAQDSQLMSHTDAVQGLITEIQGLTVLVAQQRTPVITVETDKPGWFARMFRRPATA